MDWSLVVSKLGTELLSGARTHCGRDWAASGRMSYSDPFSRIYWVERGGGTVLFSSGEKFALEPGRLFAIPSNNPARYRTEEGMVLDWIHFRADIFGCMELFSSAGLSRTTAVADRRGMDALWRRLFTQITDKSLGGRLSSDAILRDLLSFFARERGVLRVAFDKNMERILPAIDFISRNIGRRIRLRDLTEVVPMHPAYFCNVFSKTLGQSPVEFINRRRVERSQFLLLQRKSSLKEIAAELGFKDVYYFSRTFKRFAGVSPAFYRAQERHRG